MSDYKARGVVKHQAITHAWTGSGALKLTFALPRDVGFVLLFPPMVEESAKLGKILVVEDSGLQAKAFVKLLKDLGYTDVIACPHADAAHQQLKKNEYQLIFCDWQMPIKSGLEFLLEIKKDEKFAKIPFIFLTAFGEKEKVLEALKSGANDYMLKPAKPELLKEKVLRYLAPVSKTEQA